MPLNELPEDLTGLIVSKKLHGHSWLEAITLEVRRDWSDNPAVCLHWPGQETSSIYGWVLRSDLMDPEQYTPLGVNETWKGPRYA